MRPYDFLQNDDLDPYPKRCSRLFPDTRHIQSSESEQQPVTSLLNSRLLDRIACDAT